MQSHLSAGDSRALGFATTTDGLRLPVIDVTHPAFAIPDDPASLAARREAFLAWDRRNRRIPAIVTRLLMRLASRRSPLLRKILASDKEYLDSISTYMLKLGADHLPPGFDGPMDRKVRTWRWSGCACSRSPDYWRRRSSHRSPTHRTRRCVSLISRAGRRSTASTR
jgi:hypothetical protein